MDPMIADYMETGFLDNIILLFRQEPELFHEIPGLMADERMRVRLGTVALVESTIGDFRSEVEASIPGLGALLSSENPTIRGDAIHLLGVIGHPDAMPFLKAAAGDENPAVRQLALETIEEILGAQENPSGRNPRA